MSFAPLDNARLMKRHGGRVLRMDGTPLGDVDEPTDAVTEGGMRITVYPLPPAAEPPTPPPDDALLDNSR